MVNILGNKGAQLCELSQIGIPVPPGFVISTKACIDYLNEGKITDELKNEILEALSKIEERTGKKFGSKEQPLLLSVRSGAPVSMPGMMDTILNLGITDEIVEKLASLNEWFAYDTYRRFMYMFGSIVLNIEEKKFEEILEKKKEKEGVKKDQDLSVNALKEIIDEYKKIFEIPSPKEQLFLAIEAVFRSWNNERAINYRKIQGLPHDLGTGVVVQTMVFGNLGNDSCAGVAFTRNPSTGERKLYGEFLINAQGEDIVSGKRTPLQIEEMKKIFPEVYSQLSELAEKIERHYRDMQDIEFTVEKRKLYILQTRTGKRAVRAAVKIATDMVKEGLISKEEAIRRVDANSLHQLLHKQIDERKDLQIIATGLPASPGAAVGKICFSADEAAARGSEEKIILVREETTPDDIHGVVKSQGVLTSRGGLTSHAAVVSRGLGIPCIVGCSNIRIDEENEEMRVGNMTFKAGDVITIDGSTGRVIKGEAKLIDVTIIEELELLLSWADEIRKMKVYANADLPKDVQKAMELGAEGIGLCRTEHMFLHPLRLPIVRKIIVEGGKGKDIYKQLLEMQKKDFLEIFKVLKDKPIVIRLLDAPMHEFLPNYEELMKKKIRRKIREEEKRLLEIVKKMKETNPMLGYRGARVAILMPEIYRMQARAIMEAAIEAKEEGYDIKPYIEIPIVSEVNEIKEVKKQIIDEIEKVFYEKGRKVEYKIGAMIELPRACLTADEIAKEIDFMSFGTNDLTQTTFGFSRDDAEEKFLRYYVENGILREDPFAVLDEKGVGMLMKIAVEKARSIKKDMEIGICGEHGGEPKSIRFCHSIGLDVVSCSPYRVVIARLASAQAVLE